MILKVHYHPDDLPPGADRWRWTGGGRNASWVNGFIKLQEGWKAGRNENQESLDTSSRPACLYRSVETRTFAPSWWKVLLVSYQERKHGVVTSWLYISPRSTRRAQGKTWSSPQALQPPGHALQKTQSTIGQLFREFVSLDPQPGWRGSIKLLVSHINTKTLGINPRLLVTWNTSYANNKLEVTKTTKCETRFKDLAAILSSLLFRQNASKAFGNYWEVLWNGSWFHGWQWKAEQVPYFWDRSEQRENCHQQQERADPASSPAWCWKNCSLCQCHLSHPPPENAISGEGGKEFKKVKKPELEDSNWESWCLQELWLPTLLLCPLQLRDTSICSGNDWRKHISYPRTCCRSEFAADIL